MAIEFDCPFCAKLLRTPEKKAGLRAKCPGCGEPIQVPEPQPDQEAPRPETRPESRARFRAPDSHSPPPLPASADAESYDDYDEYEPRQPDPGVDDERDSQNEVFEIDGPEDDAYDDGYGPPARRERRPARASIDCRMCGERIPPNARVCRYCGEEIERERGQSRRRGLPADLEAGEVISTSWEIYKDNFGLIFGGAMVYLLCVSGAMVGAYIGTVVSALLGTALANSIHPAAGVGAGILLGVIVWLLAIGFMGFVGIGHSQFLLNAVTGRRAEIGDLFSGKSYALRMLGCSILFQLMFLVGYALCIVPGVLVMLMYWPYHYVLVDRDPPGVGCLSQAKELTDGRWGQLVIIGLAAWGVQIVGQLACGIGLLFSTPLLGLFGAVAYCRMTGQATVMD